MYALRNAMTLPSLQVSGLTRQVSQASGLIRQVSQVSGLTRQVTVCTLLTFSMSLERSLGPVRWSIIRVPFH